MPIISLQKALIDLDGHESMQKYLGEQLCRAISTTADYAVEVDAAKLQQCRANLQKIALRAKAATSSTLVDEVQSSFRGELRLYRDRASEAITHLRNELHNARTTMRSLSDGMIHSGQDLQSSVNKQLGRLKETSEQDDLATIRRTIDEVTETIASSCAKLQQQQDFIVAQLMDEIQMLHKEAEKERRAALTDPDSGAWNRQKLDTRISDLILLNQPFCLFLIVIANERQLSKDLSKEHLSTALRAMLKRAGNLFKEEVMECRWSRDSFALLSDLAANSLSTDAQQLAQALRGTYTVQKDSLSHAVFLDIRVRMVERLRGMTEAEFYPHIGQATYNIGAR